MKKRFTILLCLILCCTTFTLVGCSALPGATNSSGSSTANDSQAAGQTAEEDGIDPFEEFTWNGITLQAVGYYSMGSDKEISDQVSILGRFAIRFTVVDSNFNLDGMTGYTTLSSRINDGGFKLVDESGNEFPCQVLAAGANLEFVDIGTLELGDADSNYIRSLTFNAPEITIPVKLLDEIDDGF